MIMQTPQLMLPEAAPTHRPDHREGKEARLLSKWAKEPSLPKGAGEGKSGPFRRFSIELREVSAGVFQPKPLVA